MTTLIEAIWFEKFSVSTSCYRRPARLLPPSAHGQRSGGGGNHDEDDEQFTCLQTFLPTLSRFTVVVLVLVVVLPCILTANAIKALSHKDQ